MEILKKPVLTEKVTAQTEKFNSFTFKVDPRANKLQIKEAIEKLYGVQVERVNTMRYLGKFKTRNTKKGPVSGRASAFKKAVVVLKKGDVIDFYGNI